MIISFSIYMQFFSKLIPSLLFLSSFSVCRDFCPIRFRSRIDSRILRRARANSYSFQTENETTISPYFYYLSSARERDIEQARLGAINRFERRHESRANGQFFFYLHSMIMTELCQEEGGAHVWIIIIIGGVYNVVVPRKCKYTKFNVNHGTLWILTDIEIYKNRAIAKYANISSTHLSYVKIQAI